MIFWICVALVILIGFVVAVRFYNDQYSSGLGDAFLGFVVGVLSSGAVATILLLCLNFLPKQWKEEWYTVPLKALGSSQELEGRSYFLGGGYIGTERGLNFIYVEKDGAAVLQTVPARKSKIYEFDGSTEEPRMDYNVKVETAWWLFPWKTSEDREYKFHVPVGTVSTELKVDNN